MLDTQLLGVVLRVLELDLPAGLKVALVTHDNNGQGVAALLSKLLYPHRHLGKGIKIGDIIHDQSTLGTSVVNRIETMVLLLARCIPDAELVRICLNSLHGVWVLNSDCLLQAGCINGALLSICKFVHAKPDRN